MAPADRSATKPARPDHGAAAQLHRLGRAFFHSMAGLRDAWHEPAARLELVLVAISVPLSLWLPVTRVEKLLLVGSLVAIVVVELLNSSVESAIDRIGPERHELSRRAKDLGSAAVFVTSVMAGAVWAVLLLPLALPR